MFGEQIKSIKSKVATCLMMSPLKLRFFDFHRTGFVEAKCFEEAKRLSCSNLFVYHYTQENSWWTLKSNTFYVNAYIFASTREVTFYDQMKFEQHSLTFCRKILYNSLDSWFLINMGRIAVCNGIQQSTVYSKSHNAGTSMQHWRFRNSFSFGSKIV